MLLFCLFLLLRKNALVSLSLGVKLSSCVSLVDKGCYCVPIYCCQILLLCPFSCCQKLLLCLLLAKAAVVSLVDKGCCCVSFVDKCCCCVSFVDKDCCCVSFVDKCCCCVSLVVCLFDLILYVHSTIFQLCGTVFLG